MGAVAVGALLFAAFLLVVAMLVIQELRSPPKGPPVYVLEEVTAFAFPRLSDGAAARLDEDDVTRILEWKVHYLQGVDGPPGPRVAGGTGEAVAYVARRSADGGHSYRADDIAEVLALEAAYLADIGAVGAVVEEDEGR